MMFVSGLAVIITFHEVLMRHIKFTEAVNYYMNMDGGIEYGLYGFSKDICLDEMDAYTESKNPGNFFWGTGKVATLAETYDATISLLEKSDGDDFTNEIAIYNKELKKQQEIYKKYIEEEINSINEIAKMF